MKHTVIILSAIFSLMLVSLSAQPFASNFSPTPVFTDNFKNGGTPNPHGRWIIDPDLTTVVGGAVLDPPSFVSATPGTINAALVALQPVENAPSADNAVMMVGNDAADAGTHFGLAYIDLADPDGTGSGTSYQSLVNYRLVANVYCVGTSTNAVDRYQVGLYAHAGVGHTTDPLFRFGPFHDNIATGGGPGFGSRGSASNTVAIPGTSALAASRWVKMSCMVLGDQVAICVDANGDNVLNESDPLEYQAYSRDLTDIPNGYPAVWAVGIVSRDVWPMFVDDVELYLGPPSSEELWELY